MRLLGSSLLCPPPLRLVSGRVLVRPPRPDDWDEWAALRAGSRPFLTPWEPSWAPDCLSRSSFQRRLRRQAVEWREDQGYSFLVCELASERVVGGIGLSNVRRGVAQMATLGYWVGEPFARQGFTFGAVGLILEYAFQRQNLHRVEASCLPTNAASRALLEKAGFGYEGYARQYLRINGVWRDHLLFAMLKEDWAAASESKRDSKRSRASTA